MHIRRFIAVPLVALAGIIGLAACQHNVPAGNAAESKAQAEDTASLVTNQPIPHFNYSQIRQNVIELEAAQANGAQTTSFFFNQGVQDPIGSCLSIGSPIATTTQLTNPQQITWKYTSSNGSRVDGVIGQMDPNGIYTGNSTGTYVMCVTADGKVEPKYWEGFVETDFGVATWDNVSHTVKLLGPPTGGFTKK